MAQIDPSTWPSLNGRDFVKALSAVSDKQVTDLLDGPDRELVLHEIFRRFPERFLPDRAPQETKVIQWWTSGGPNGKDAYEITLGPEGCSVRKGPASDDPYDVSLLTGPVELAKLTTGRANPVFLVMRGKVKARGDLALANGLLSYFERPKR